MIIISFLLLLLLLDNWFENENSETIKIKCSSDSLAIKVSYKKLKSVNFDNEYRFLKL